MKILALHDFSKMPLNFTTRCEAQFIHYLHLYTRFHKPPIAKELTGFQYLPANIRLADSSAVTQK